ncbi:MAG: ABC transporter ATP-binding protein [Ilumatobacteraceae bacterium]
MSGAGHAHLRELNDAVLQVRDLEVTFGSGRAPRVQAVSGVSFDIARGETLGIVGESGCGKSTTGRAIMQMPPATAGSVLFEGDDLGAMSPSELRLARTRVQMIFQDPISSLNPRRRVRDSVAEPLDIWSRGTPAERRQVVDDILADVGIDPERAAVARPHEFSGGQCQRISIARALVLSPTLLICDEPVSALDVSVQAQVLNLLEDLKARYSLTMMFIAHDLAVVKNISDRVAVMYLGRLCEIAPSRELYAHPAHHYTRVLLDSIPVPDPEVTAVGHELVGDLPSPVDPPSGCRFHTRCPAADDRCRTEEPVMRAVGEDHYVACHHPLVTPVAIST